MRKILTIIIVLSLFLGMQHQAVSASPESGVVITRDGWSFDRSELVWPDRANPEEQKAKGTFGGANGWVEYDFEIPKTGWYELWEKNGVYEWSRDIYLDGKVMVWQNGSLPEDRHRVSASESWYKEMNLYLEAGKHVLRIQRQGFPGILPEGWELRAGNGRPEASIRAVKIKHNVIKAGTIVTLRFTGGAPESELTYKLMIMQRDADTKKVHLVKEAGTITFPATAKPIQKEVGIEFPKQGVFFLMAQSGDRPARPADIKAEKFIVIDTKNAPDPAKELKTTPVITIDCVGQTINGNPVQLGETYFEKDGKTKLVEKPFGKYRESSGKGRSVPGHHDPFNLWGLDAFSYRFDLPDADHMYRLTVTYPDDDQRSMGFWVNDSVPRTGDTGIPVTGGVETGGSYRLSNGWLTHQAFFFPRNAKGVVFAAINLNKGSRAAAAKVVIERVDSTLPACPLSRKDGGRVMGFSFEEGPRWRRFFGARLVHGDGISENLRTLDRWGQWNRYLGANLMSPSVSVYGELLYPSHVLSGYNSAPENVSRMVALMAEKYDGKYIPELYLSGKPVFDKLEMGVWTETKTENGKKITEVKVRSPEVRDIIIMDNDGQMRCGWRDYVYNPLHPAIQNKYLEVIGELADQLADTQSFAGISTRLMLGWQWTGWDALPGLKWGYDDWTVNSFTKETGINVPGAPDDPRRFRQRFDYLTSKMREEWQNWRCQKMFNYYCKLRDRIQQAKPDAKLYFNYYGPDERNVFARDILGQMREIGIDWRMFEKETGFAFIQNPFTGRRFTTPVMNAENRESLLAPANLQIAKLGARAFGSYTSYYEVNKSLDWGQLGAKYTDAFDSCSPPGIYEREYFALALADADTSVFVYGGNGWMFGTPPVMQPFLKEYRTLPMDQFTPFEKGRDPVAVWYHHSPKGTYFYAVNRLPVPVKVTLSLDRAGTVTRLGNGEQIPLHNGNLEFTLDPFMMRSFKHGAQHAKLNECQTVVEDKDLLAELPPLVEFARQLAEDVRGRQVGPELTDTQAEDVLLLLNDTVQAYKDGRYAAIRTNLGRLNLTRLYNLTGHYPPGLLSKDRPSGKQESAPHLEPLGKTGELADTRFRMNSITELVYDAEGHLWAASGSRVTQFDHQGNYLKTFPLTLAGKPESGDARYDTLGMPRYADFTRLRVTPDKRLIGMSAQLPPTIYESLQGRLLPLTYGNSILLPKYNGRPPKMAEVLGVDHKGAIYLVFLQPEELKGVWKFHSDGTADYAFITDGQQTNRFSDAVASDIVFDTYGKAYLAVGNDIHVRDLDGKLLAVVPGGSASGIVRLAVSDDGNILIALTKQGRELSLFEGDNEKQYSKRWTSPLQQTATSIAWKQSGVVTVGFKEQINGAVVADYRFDDKMAVPHRAMVSAPASSVPHLSGPTQLKTYEGKVHYLTGNKLWRLVPAKDGIAEEAELVFDPRLKAHQDIISFAFDPQGNLYFGSNIGFWAGQRGILVYRCQKQGDTWSEPKLFTDKPIQDGWHYTPTDLEFNAKGDLIVRMKENKIRLSSPQISIFSRSLDGKTERLVSLGPTVGWGSYGVHQTSDGKIFIAGGGCRSVVALAPNGKELWKASFNKQQDKHSVPFRDPTGITTDSKGRVWITDSAANQILCLSQDGALIKIYGKFGTADNREGLSLNMPRGITTKKDSAGQEWLYVADVGNQRLLKLQIKDEEN